MSATPNQALSAALALMTTRNLLEDMRRHDLPADVSFLFRILADEAGAIEMAQGMFAYSPAQLKDAAEFYVKEVVLYAQAPPLRMLGFNAMASRTEMRDRLRLLMLWLHPDRQKANWQQFYAARVLTAWRTVQSNSGTKASAVLSQSQPARHSPARRPRAPSQPFRPHRPTWVAYGPVAAQPRPFWRRKAPLLVLAALAAAIGFDYSLNLSGYARSAVDAALSEVGNLGPVEQALRLLREE